MSRTIDLGALDTDHSANVAEMVAAIKHDGDRSLWTCEMRAAVRGGKPMMVSRIEEDPPQVPTRKQ